MKHLRRVNLVHTLQAVCFFISSFAGFNIQTIYSKEKIELLKINVFPANASLFFLYEARLDQILKEKSREPFAIIYKKFS